MLFASRKNILKYIDFTFERFDNPDKTRVFITHTSAAPEVVDAVRKKLIDFGFAPENINERHNLKVKICQFVEGV